MRDIIVSRPLYSQEFQNVRSSRVCLEIADQPHSKCGHNRTWLDIDYILFEALEFWEILNDAVLRRDAERFPTTFRTASSDLRSEGKGGA